MPFWEYEVPPEEREEVFNKLLTYAKPGVQLSGMHYGEAWSVETTHISYTIGNRIFVEFRDKKWGGLATYEFDKEKGRFLITDSDFPYPLEFIILREYIGIDTKNWKLLKSG